MVSNRILGVDSRDGGWVEEFYVCYQMTKGLKRVFLVRADSEEEAMESARKDFGDGEFSCSRNRLGIPESAMGVVFAHVLNA